MWRAGRERLAGAGLVLAGLLALAERAAPDLLPYLPGAIGLLLLVGALALRSSSLLVAGGLLAGAGAGLLVARSAEPALALPAVLAGAGAGLLGAAVIAFLLRIDGRRRRVVLSGALLVGIAVLIPATDRSIALGRLLAAWWPAALVVAGALVWLRAQPDLAGPDDETIEWSPVPDEALPEPDPDGWTPGPPIDGLR